MRGWRARTAALGAVALVAMCGSGVAPAMSGTQPVTPGPPPPPGSPGGQGPCTEQSFQSVPNPYDRSMPVSIFYPGGDAPAPDGGRCDDAHRPVILFAHGYAAITPALYSRQIAHLTGRGHVVVFPTYGIWYEPHRQYTVVDAGMEAAVLAAADRVDTSRFGVVGHSYGGGMSPRIVQRAAARGWGSQSLWMFAMAPHYAQLVGRGPIVLPPHTRAVVTAFDRDTWVDARIGIEMFLSLDLPLENKHHVMVGTDWYGALPLESSHISPNTIIPPLTRDDNVDFYALDRNLDLTAACADGDVEACGEDLSYMGTWNDGRAVTPATVSTTPVDVGPRALQECTFFLNPRRCP